MKPTLKLSFVFAALLSLSPAVFAQRESAGGHDGNGGDPTEMEFKNIASNIGAWIRAGNASALKLPPELRLTSYRVSMLEAVDNYHVSFTTSKITVGGAEKTCMNGVSANVERIVCNIERFRATPKGDEQYRLVHHELAGLAGVEVSHGDESDYRISDQISAYLEEKTVLSLPIEYRQPKLASMQNLGVFGSGTEVVVAQGSCTTVNQRDVMRREIEMYITKLVKILARTTTPVQSVSLKIGHISQAKFVGHLTNPSMVRAAIDAKLTLANGLTLQVDPTSSDYYKKRGFDSEAFFDHPVHDMAIVFHEITEKKNDRNGGLLEFNTFCRMSSQLENVDFLDSRTHARVLSSYELTSGEH